MKVRVGGRQIQDIRLEGAASASQLRIVEAEIANSIISRIFNDVAVVSPRRLMNLAAAVENAAMREALQLFSVISSVIDSKTPGIRGEQLSTFYAQAGGTVPWRPLSLNYLRWKRRRELRRSPKSASRADRSRAAARSDGFFVLSGQLKSYFNRNGRSIILNRFGGVRVHVNTNNMQQTGILRDDVHDVRKFVLGSISVEIFPNISASLMPMLASGRWTENPGRNYFEQAMLPDKVATKLSGGRRGHYRPLVLPITQFFILHRIPGAIARDLKKSIPRYLR